jgi:CHAD domain-containing protein
MSAADDEVRAVELVTLAIAGLVERTRTAANALVATGAARDAVHDFRVALRRQRSGLEAARGLFHADVLEEVDAVLWRHGQATGALRDADVLEETLAASILDARSRAVMATWLGEQRAHEDELRAQAVALVAGPELEIVNAALLDLLASPPRKNPPVHKLAQKRFARAVRRVRAHLPADGSDSQALHRLRIRFKRLRYLSEMLGHFMSIVVTRQVSERQRLVVERDLLIYREAVPHATAMQKALGLLHDADEALLVVERARIGGDARAAVLTALHDLRRRLAERALGLLATLPPTLVGHAPVAGGAP